MSEIAGNIMSIFSFALEGYFLRKMYAGHPENKYARTPEIMGTVWFFTNTLSFVFISSSSENISFAKLMIYVLLTSAFSVALCGGSFFGRLFPAVQFIAVRELSTLAATCLSFLGDPFTAVISALVCRGIMPAEKIDAAFGVYSFISLCLMFSAKILLIYTVIKRLEKYEIPEKDEAIYLLPSAAGVAASALIRLIFVTIENGYTVTLYLRYPMMYFIIPCISILLLATAVLGASSCSAAAELRAVRAERTALEGQITALSEAAVKKESMYGGLRALRHDINNSLSVLRDMLGKKLPEDDEAIGFMDDMKLYADHKNLISTGNAVSDAVINSRSEYAESILPDIIFDADGFVFSSGNIRPYHIGIILSNALDNAIEACARMKEKHPDERKYIKLISYRKNNMLFIEVKNSFDGTVMTDGKGFPVTLKADTELHGIGLKSIKKCAEKYSGGIDISYDEKVFTLTVMLMD